MNMNQLELAVNKINRCFLALVPVRKLSFEDSYCCDDRINLFTSEQLLLLRSEQGQSLIYSRVLCSPIAKRYPPPISYRKSFISWVLKTLVGDSLQTDENLLSEYLELISIPREHGGEEMKSYQTFILCKPTECTCKCSSDHCVTVRISSSLLSAGTTGLSTWEAALCLAEFLMLSVDLTSSHDQTPFGRLKGSSSFTIVEVGCGSGFSGLAAAKLLEMSGDICGTQARLILTDHHVAVGEYLKDTLDARDGNIGRDWKVEWERLDWRDVFDRMREGNGSDVWLQDSKRCCESGVDVVLASDVVFDGQICAPLASTLLALLRTQRESVAYVSSTIRNRETFLKFEEALEGFGLVYETVYHVVNGCCASSLDDVDAGGGWLYYELENAEYVILKVTIPREHE